MAKILREQLIDLFILNSPRLGFHRMIAFTRPKVHPFVIDNCEYISVDGTLVHDFIKCKICHTFCRFTKTNRFGIIQHLENMHKLHNPKKASIKIRQSIQTEDGDAKKKQRKSPSEKYERTDKALKILKHPSKPLKKSNPKAFEMRAPLHDERMDSTSVENLENCLLFNQELLIPTSMGS